MMWADLLYYILEILLSYINYYVCVLVVCGHFKPYLACLGTKSIFPDTQCIRVGPKVLLNANIVLHFKITVYQPLMMQCMLCGLIISA